MLGNYAEFAVVAAWRVVPVPDGLPLDRAAACMFHGLTAHYLAYDLGRFGPGVTCLVHSASGGIGQLDEAERAHEALETRRSVGRPLLRIGAAAAMSVARSKGVPMSWLRLGIALSGLLLLTPTVASAASYDAIVIDDDLGGAKGNGDYAVGQGASRREAERIAMSNCTLGGNVACKVVLTFRQCGAYASSPRGSGTGTGPTLEAASASALAMCREKTCRVVVADCVNQSLRPPR